MQLVSPNQSAYVNVNSLGTGTIPDSDITTRVMENFDFRPQAIIEDLGLRSPIFLERHREGILEEYLMTMGVSLGRDSIPRRLQN